MTTATAAAPTDRDSGAVPVWTSVLTVVLAPVAFLFGGLSPMAADSCGPGQCAALEATLSVVAVCWFASWTLTPLLVLASWFFSGTAVGRWSAWTALVPPVIVILLVLGL
ncbi:hypothetical protein [Streptomyces sp. NPDC059564]|uniref:hypothetical protein n=1 Tax=Streptomyces sp. NPDC059564 TaxID=3346865 RepID=UPI0036A4C434